MLFSFNCAGGAKAVRLDKQTQCTYNIDTQERSKCDHNACARSRSWKQRGSSAVGGAGTVVGCRGSQCDLVHVVHG